MIVAVITTGLGWRDLAESAGYPSLCIPLAVQDLPIRVRIRVWVRVGVSDTVGVRFRFDLIPVVDEDVVDREG